MSVKFTTGLNNLLNEAVKDSVVDGTNLVYEEVLHLVLDTSKTGHIYKTKNGTHQASAAGEPFANMTGNALQLTKVDFRRNNYEGIVSGNADYAADLELGNSKMEPRPVFRPALFNKKDQIVSGFIKNINRVLK